MKGSLVGARPATVSTEAALRRFTGTFVDARLESAFLVDSREELKKFTRFSITISVFFFLAFGLHDAFVIPSVRAMAWTVRYGVFGPVAVAVLLFVTLARDYTRWHQPTMLLFGMTLNLVVIWIGAVSPPAGYFIYTSFAVMFVTLGPFIARMNVTTQVTYTILTFVLFNAFDLAVAHATTAVRFSMALTLASLGGLGAIIAYQLEMQARRSYLQSRVIREQITQLDAEKDKSDVLLLNVLPADIAARLKEDGHSIADGFADVTVLFLDIVGFTSMSARLTPAELVDRLNAIFSQFDDLTEEIGVEKIKTIGDAYMAVAGLSTHTKDHPMVMAQMALRMRSAVRELAKTFGEPLDVRIGMSTGPVVAGVIGKKKFIYDVWGDTVNTASRMESHSAPGQIHVTAATCARLSGSYKLECRGEIDVKGKGPMTTYFLGGPA